MKQFTPQEFSDHCKKIIDEIDRGELGFAKLAIAGLDAMFQRSGEAATVGNHTDRADVFIVKDADMIPQSSGFIVPADSVCELRDYIGGLYLFNGDLYLKTQYNIEGSFSGNNGDRLPLWDNTAGITDSSVVLPVKFVARGDDHA